MTATATKKIKMTVGRTMTLKATERNLERAIERSLSRDGGEYAVSGNDNGLILIKRTL